MSYKTNVGFLSKKKNTQQQQQNLAKACCQCVDFSFFHVITKLYENIFFLLFAT